jgi:hypothetical protein
MGCEACAQPPCAILLRLFFLLPPPTPPSLPLLIPPFVNTYTHIISITYRRVPRARAAPVRPPRVREDHPRAPHRQNAGGVRAAGEGNRMFFFPPVQTLLLLHLLFSFFRLVYIFFKISLQSKSSLYINMTGREWSSSLCHFFIFSVPSFEIIYNRS